jgi:hypothetical protein
MASDEAAFLAVLERGMWINFVMESILISFGAFAGYMYMPGTSLGPLLGVAIGLVGAYFSVRFSTWSKVDSAQTR